MFKDSYKTINLSPIVPKILVKRIIQSLCKAIGTSNDSKRYLWGAVPPAGLNE